MGNNFNNAGNNNEVWKQVFATTAKMSPTGAIFTESSIKMQSDFVDLLLNPNMINMPQAESVIIAPRFTKAKDSIEDIDCIAVFNVRRDDNGPISKRGGSGNKGDRMNVMTYVGSGGGDGNFTIKPDDAKRLMAFVAPESIKNERDGKKSIIFKAVKGQRRNDGELVTVALDFFAMLGLALGVAPSDEMNYSVMNVTEIKRNEYSFLISKYIDANQRTKGRTGRNIDINQIKSMYRH